MALPVILGAGLAAAGALSNAYSQEKARKSRIKGLRDLSKVTESERDYIKRKREIIESGDPVLNEAYSRGIQTTRQVGSVNQMAAQGAAIQQGLENSIVAQELRRRVDRDTLRSVAEQARDLAARNKRAADMAQLDIDKMNMSIEQRQLNARNQIRDIQATSPNTLQLLTNIAQAGYSGAVGMGYGNEKPQVVQPWESVPIDTIQNLSDADAQSFFDSLNPTEKLQFIEYMQSGGIK